MNSEERLKRFWKWCGFEDRWDAKQVYIVQWHYPDGNNRIKLPQITLNNLFKWAVPKVLEEIGRERLVALVNNALCDSIEAKVDVKDYLFLAIEKLIEEGK